MKTISKVEKERQRINRRLARKGYLLPDFPRAMLYSSPSRLPLLALFTNLRSRSRRVRVLSP